MDDLSNPAMKVYLYLCLHGNFKKGRTHRIRYQDIADYCEMHVRTAQRALAELEESGFFKMKDAGSMVGILPDQLMITQYQYASKNEKEVEAFWKAFLKMKAELNDGRSQEIGNQRVYEKLRNDRARSRDYYPRQTNFKQFWSKYQSILDDPD